MKLNKIRFVDLEKVSTSEYISYSAKLQTIEWAKRREVILIRDEFTCQKCKVRHSKIIDDKPYLNHSKEEEEKFVENIKKGIDEYMKLMGFTFPIPNQKDSLHEDYQPTYLHVHHKYYIINTHPWNYPDEALISVCKSCHQEIHNSEDIPVYESQLMDLKMAFTKCERCNGTGFLSEYHYHMNGICFQCNGNEYNEKR